MKTTLLSFVLAFSLVSCDLWPDKKKEKISTLISLIDLSDSVEESNILFYIEDIEKKLLPILDEKTKLIILAIDNGSETAATPLYDLDMTTMDFENASVPVSVRKKQAEQTKKQFLEELQANFKEDILASISARKNLTGSTDIFGSLKQIERYVEGETKVFIFSDMVNYSSVSNMERIIKQKRKLSDHLREAPQIKSSGNIQIYVCTGDNTKLGIQTYNDIKSFWEEYFKENNYLLVDYTSARLRI